MPLIIIGLFLLFGLIFLANVAEVRPGGRLRHLVHRLLQVVNAPLLLFGVALLALPSELFGRFFPRSGLAEAIDLTGAVLFGLGLWGALVTAGPVRQRLARWLPLDPRSPVHTLALVLTGYLVANTILTLGTAGLEGLAESAEELAVDTVLAVVLPQLLFVLLALTGVGWWTRRSRQEIAGRLGLAPFRFRQLITATGWVWLMLIAQGACGALWAALNPEQAELLDTINTLLLAEVDTVGEWLVLAAAAAIGEELLFRGALQPVFGLVPTAALFAVVHVQYGFTLINVFVFVLGIALGLIRQRAGTTAAIFVHFGYNFILGLFSLLLPYLERLAG